MLRDKPQNLDLVYFSTDNVPRTQRLECWATALSQALIPMSVTSEDPGNFRASTTTATLGPLRVTRNQGGVHDSHRTSRDVARSEDRCYHLLVSLDAPWQLTHGGRSLLRPGDLILHDSQLEHEINIRTSFDILNIRLPVEWLHTWIPDPQVLVGHPIPGDSPWGRVLSPAVSQLRPDLVVAAPLPPKVLSDHLGVMLAIVAGEFEKTQQIDRVLLERIEHSIQERCIDPGLTADQVAAALGIPTQTMHHQLACARVTFTSRLLDARVSRAVQLLRSSREGTLPLCEIARRAGFAQGPQLDRVIKKRFGCRAGELRDTGVSPAGGRDKGA
jgi:AraC-like DNA-binding protein